MAKNKDTKNFVLKNSNDVWYKNPDVIRNFLNQRPDYEQLCIEMAYILEKRLKAQEIDIATVTQRAKTLKSFLEKIERKKYGNPFDEITDFAGVRVVCLYLNDIPLIEEIIQNEFKVLEKVDKLNDKGADRFGYGAIHFIVQLGKSSLGARYDDLKSLVCEIQVRTVLQDAWAIIDHHLVYKNESDIPTPLQRKLNSLAGLFETADDQFDHVRTERTTYLTEVIESQSNRSQFLNNELNKDSFEQYLQWKFPDLPQEYFEGQTDMIFEDVKKRNYSNLSELDDEVEKSKTALEKVNKELEPLKHLLYGAAQIFIVLLLTDNQYRHAEAERIGFELRKAVEKYAIKKTN